MNRAGDEISIHEIGLNESGYTAPIPVIDNDPIDSATGTTSRPHQGDDPSIKKNRRRKGTEKYLLLQKKLEMNKDKFSVEEISNIQVDMEKYLEKQQGIPDLQSIHREEYELVNEVSNKDLLKVKLEELKAKHNHLKEQYKEQLLDSHNLFESIRKRIEKKAASSASV